MSPTDSLTTFYVNAGGNTRAGSASIAKAVLGLNLYWKTNMADFITWDGTARVFVNPPNYVIDHYWEDYKKKNNITDAFVGLGVENKNAFDSQALIQLKNEYCNQKRCLQCSVGNRLLKTVITSGT